MGRHEKGVSLSGFLVICVLLFFGLLLVFKIGPAHFEYYQVNKALHAVASDPEMQSATPLALRQAFDRRAQIDDINSITGADLEISKADSGGPLLEASWAVKVKLAGTVSACMDFEASSAR